MLNSPSDSTRNGRKISTISCQRTRPGSFEKVISGTDFEATVKVGQFLTKRENVCTKNVIGTREVPEEVIPSKS
jgi:hypothetical protein